ncbi:MAG TPA: hypothetical protein VL086_16560 [Candidatus Nitrosotalea sp.]|jgi:hypothetical protein|nr:hypothetical protein [Candidatus Nitrosotalea sp.]
MRGLAVVVALAGWLAAGCASSLSGAIPAYPSASQLETDMQACEQTATGRAEFERRADYMSCMIAQGYRTYVSAATYWTMAELTVSAGKKQAPPQSQVRLDLQTCATEAGAVAGARPLELAEAVEWVNVKVLRREPGRDAALGTVFAQCLAKRGYATRPVSRVASD